MFTKLFAVNRNIIQLQVVSGFLPSLSSSVQGASSPPAIPSVRHRTAVIGLGRGNFDRSVVRGNGSSRSVATSGISKSFEDPKRHPVVLDAVSEAPDLEERVDLGEGRTPVLRPVPALDHQVVELRRTPRRPIQARWFSAAAAVLSAGAVDQLVDGHVTEGVGVTESDDLPKRDGVRPYVTLAGESTLEMVKHLVIWV